MVHIWAAVFQIPALVLWAVWTKQVRPEELSVILTLGPAIITIFYLFCNFPTPNFWGIKLPEFLRQREVRLNPKKYVKKIGFLWPIATVFWGTSGYRVDTATKKWIKTLVLLTKLFFSLFLQDVSLGKCLHFFLVWTEKCQQRKP